MLVWTLFVSSFVPSPLGGLFVIPLPLSFFPVCGLGRPSPLPPPPPVAALACMCAFCLPSSSLLVGVDAGVCVFVCFFLGWLCAHTCSFFGLPQLFYLSGWRFVSSLPLAILFSSLCPTHTCAHTLSSPSALCAVLLLPLLLVLIMDKRSHTVSGINIMTRPQEGPPVVSFHPAIHTSLRVAAIVPHPNGVGRDRADRANSHKQHANQNCFLAPTPSLLPP